MIIHNMEQGTPEWFEARKCKVTASCASAIGNCGAGLETLVFKVMSEYYSSQDPVRYTSRDMDRGNELEQYAREMYELETGNKVEEVGFCEYDKYSGASPDGLVGSDGLIEIKAKNDEKHFKQIIKGDKEIESGYIWQMQMQMLVTDRKWCDFVSYNPNFKQTLCITRIYRDETKISKLKDGIRVAGMMIESIKKRMNDKI